MGHIAHPRNQTHLLKAMIISQHWFGEGKTIISFLISEWSLFVKPWVSFTMGCFVTSLGEIGPLVLKKMFKFRQCIFAIALSLLRKGHGPSSEQTWIPFTQGCFMPSLVEICQVVLEKKKLRFLQCIFGIS